MPEQANDQEKTGSYVDLVTSGTGASKGSMRHVIEERERDLDEYIKANISIVLNAFANLIRVGDLKVKGKDDGIECLSIKHKIECLKPERIFFKIELLGIEEGLGKFPDFASKIARGFYDSADEYCIKDNDGHTARKAHFYCDRELSSKIISISFRYDFQDFIQYVNDVLDYGDLPPVRQVDHKMNPNKGAFKTDNFIILAYQRQNWCSEVSALIKDSLTAYLIEDNAYSESQPVHVQLTPQNGGGFTLSINHPKLGALPSLRPMSFTPMPLEGVLSKINSLVGEIYSIDVSTLGAIPKGTGAQQSKGK